MAMINLSLYSVIGLIAFAVVAVIGIVVKLIIRSKRKKVNGVRGFAPQTPEEALKDGWKRL